MYHYQLKYSRISVKQLQTPWGPRWTASSAVVSILLTIWCIIIVFLSVDNSAVGIRSLFPQDLHGELIFAIAHTHLTIGGNGKMDSPCVFDTL